MVTVFTVCAVFGSSIMVLQILMAVFGMDGDSEAIADVGDDLDMGDEYVDTHNLSSQFFGILSFRSIMAALAFFGIGGHIGNAGGYQMVVTLGIAVGMGFAAMVAVGWMMQMLYKLKSDGTVNINNAIGTVYLTIPAKNEGAGKVTLSIQNRTMEYQAVTQEEEDIASTAGFLSSMANTLPPMLQVMKDIGGIELPETIAKISGNEGDDSGEKSAVRGSSAVKARASKPKPKAE